MSKLQIACIEKGFFGTIIKNLDKLARAAAIRSVRRKTPIDSKKIVFLNFSGNYECNPKYICQRLIDEGVDFKPVWGINKDTQLSPGSFPSQVKTVIRETYAFYKEISGAKIIVDNGISLVTVRYPKKKGQYVIETWHGSLGIKKFGRSSNQDRLWLARAEKQGKITDFIISNSDMEDDIYREDFWKTTPIWKFGHPRNDVLFCDDKKAGELDRRIRSRFKIPENTKLCLYAPTFRDDGDVSPYTIDYQALSDALSEKFGGSFVILTRFHWRMRDLMKTYHLPGNVIDVSSYEDIQELERIIDVGITDYSSWICEYMLRRKPGFTFATDVKNYAGHERQLFFPLSALPFPTSSDMDGLLKSIKDFDNDKYISDCDAFLKEKGSVDDGQAAKRTAAEIKKLMAGGTR